MSLLLLFIVTVPKRHFFVSTKKFEAFKARKTARPFQQMLASSPLLVAKELLNGSYKIGTAISGLPQISLDIARWN